MEHQNWKPSYIISKNPKGSKDEAEGGSRHGHNIGTNKKMPGVNPYSVDDDIMKVDHVEHDLKIAIQQARNAKGWTQQDLALRLTVKPDIIKSYENGTAIPDNGFIAKMEKVLDAKLPRHKKAK